MSSFNAKIIDVLKDTGKPMNLTEIYKIAGMGQELNSEFKRKVRRSLYHLGKSGDVERVGPATYRYVG